MKIGHISDTEVFLHWSWLLIIPVGWLHLTRVYFAPQMATHPQWMVMLTSLVAFALIFLSTLAHESGHIIFSAVTPFGVKKKKIVLFILGGIFNVEETPKNWQSELFSAIAGPITSIILAVFFITAWSEYRDFAPLALLYALLATYNITLGLANIIPAYPLDGARVVRAVIWNMTNNELIADQVTIRLGILLGICLTLIGFFNHDPLLLVVGVVNVFLCIRTQKQITKEATT